jgi:alginate O-acetyltransferase complex protein AlgI
MTFTSLEFIGFLPLCFLLYWYVFKKNAGMQNVFLVVASLVFYAWSSLFFLALLIFSAIFNFYLGIGIFSARNQNRKRLFLWLGVLINLLPLLCFKYFIPFFTSGPGFFGDVFAGGLMLPLGISFYTFQMLGYIIDIYNEEIEAEKNILPFAVYVCFFPKIIAGPIEPAQDFLPQVKVKRVFNYDLAVEGLRQIIWGLFVKIVIANNCASLAGPLFSNYMKFNGSTLFLGAFLYLFQVYCDFSGYSNIAVGVSKLFGIRLMRNFSAPFFSTNISEYWRKWHISLTLWMVKYIFTPLSFLLRKYKKAGLIISILVTFLLVGLWHGANWTFIVFGALHGLYFIPLLIFGKRRSLFTKGESGFSFNRILKMIALFLIVMLTCIFFGSDTLSHSLGYLEKIFSPSIFSPLQFSKPDKVKAFIMVGFICCLLIVEWLQQNRKYELQLDAIKNPYLRRSIYYALVLAILFFGSVNHIEFIYAHF